MSKHYSQNLNQLPRNSVNMDNKGLVRDGKSAHKLGGDNEPVCKLRERRNCRLENGQVDSLGGSGDRKETKVEVREHCGGGGDGACWTYRAHVLMSPNVPTVQISVPEMAQKCHQ